MERIRMHLKNTYHLSNYQLSQISFLFKTLGSEFSKILIMGILFYRQLPLYFFALFIMVFLRSSTGGLHFYTYAGCLMTSVIYMFLTLVALPCIPVRSSIPLLLLLFCILCCYRIGPIASKYRPKISDQNRIHRKNITCIFIFFYSLALYIIPQSPFLIAGFWVIILHSLQLILAKIREKGDA